jgi:hypothetical protein
LVDCRDQPIIGCLEYISEYLLTRIANVQGAIDKSPCPLTITATIIFKVIMQEANDYATLWNDGDTYQCKGPWMDQCVVKMKLKTCTCKK